MRSTEKGTSDLSKDGYYLRDVLGCFTDESCTLMSIESIVVDPMSVDTIVVKST